MNIHAPNRPTGRATFFSLLIDWPWPSQDIILAGEFYSVQSTHLDHFGGTRTGHPESAQLGLLLNTLGLEDARILSAPADGNGPPKPTEISHVLDQIDC